MSSGKKVKVIVDGTEYIVEVGDITTRPVQAKINQTTYQVDVEEQAAAPGKAAAAPIPVAVPTPQAQQAAPAVSGSAISAPMPGDIIEVNVSAGDKVSAGDTVCVLEAMKMKNMIRSSREGVIAEVHVSSGQAVAYGDKLVSFE